MAYLHVQAKKAGSFSFEIPFDRQELADFLEVERSGLSSEIGKLKREGVILAEKNRFTLLSGDWKRVCSAVSFYKRKKIPRREPFPFDFIKNLLI